MNYLQEEQDEVDEQDAEEVDDGDGDEDEEEHDKHQEIDLVDVERQKQTHIGDGLMLEGLIAEDVPQSVDGGYGSIVDGFMFYS